MKTLLCALLLLSSTVLSADELWEKTIANVTAARSWRPSKIVFRAEMVGAKGTEGYQERTYHVQTREGAAVAVQVARSENGVEKPVDETTPVPLDRLIPREPFFERKAQSEMRVQRQPRGEHENGKIASYRFQYGETSGTVIVDTDHALPLQVSCTVPAQTFTPFSSGSPATELRYAIERDGVWHPTVVTTRASESAGTARTLILSIRFQSAQTKSR